MSEYTTEEILKLIEENGGPEELDLSGKDLSGLDLSREALAAEFERARAGMPSRDPAWGSGIETINLFRAKLQGARLVSAKLQGARLVGTKLQRAVLNGANLQGANLEWSKLQGARLVGANLQGANLNGSNLQGARLVGANLQGATMDDAKLHGADLRNSHIEKVDFFGTEGLHRAYFYNAFLDDTRIRRDQLGEAIGEELEGRYDQAKEAYLALKNNFEQIGRYDDATWAYLKERRMEKREAAQKAREAWQKHDWKATLRHSTKAAGDRFIEVLCDYGEGLGHVVRSLITVWVGFALIYGLIAGVWASWQDTGEEMIRYITRNPIDLLTFSLGAMTTLLPTGLEARPILAMRILMPLEALIGIFLVALLGFVAGNRIRRS